MAYEVKPWKKPGCDLTLRVDDFSDREESSREINEADGEGGDLHANYRTVDAVAHVVSILAIRYRLQYGKDFIFKTGGGDTITLDFCNRYTRDFAHGL